MHPKHYAQGCINHRCIGGFIHKPTRDVSGPILRGVEEQVHKGICSPCSGRSLPFQKSRDNCKVHNMRLRRINDGLDTFLLISPSGVFSATALCNRVNILKISGLEKN
jgi:hypothetical protein